MSTLALDSVSSTAFLRRLLRFLTGQSALSALALMCKTFKFFKLLWKAFPCCNVVRGQMDLQALDFAIWSIATDAIDVPDLTAQGSVILRAVGALRSRCFLLNGKEIHSGCMNSTSAMYHQ